MKKNLIFLMIAVLGIGLVYQTYTYITMKPEPPVVTLESPENTLPERIETLTPDEVVQDDESNRSTSEITIQGDVNILDPQCYTVIDRIIAYHTATGSVDPVVKMDELIGPGEFSVNYIEWPPGEFEGYKGLQIYFQRRLYQDKPTEWEVIWTVRFQSDNTWFFTFTFENKDNGEYRAISPFDWRMFVLNQGSRP